MVRLYVRHDVADYDTWRQHYDNFDAERQDMGVTGDAVYRELDNPNDLTVWHDFSSRQAAESFASSPRLREVMQEAGVQGQPDVWMTEEL